VAVCYVWVTADCHKFRYLATTVTHRSSMRGEMQSRQDARSAYWRSVRKHFPFRFLSENIEIKIHRRTFLRVHLYGCETWLVTLREGHRLRVFENRVLREREEVAGDWRRLHDEELHHLYRSPHIIRMIRLRRMRWVLHVAGMGGVGGGRRE
jgi:hypothetical protein